MATTVIDALIVELGLDPSGFTRGRKQAADDMLKTRQDAERTAKDIEAAGKRAASFYSQMRNEVLGLFAAFTAGKGIKEFVRDTFTTDAALGRLSVTMKESVQDLSAWRNTAVAFGGTADGVTASMQGLVHEFQQFTLTGESSVIPYFRALGVNVADANGEMRKSGDILLDLADKFAEMRNPARAAEFGRQLGFDQGTINMLLQGRKAVEDMLKTQKQYAPTKEDVQAAYEFQRAILELQVASASLGRALLTDLAPSLKTVMGWLKALADWGRAHMPVVRAAFYSLAAAATALGVAMAVNVGATGVQAVLTGFRLILGAIPALLLRMALLTNTAFPALSATLLGTGAAAETAAVGLYALLGWLGLAVAAYLALGAAGKWAHDNLLSDKSRKMLDDQVAGDIKAQHAAESGETLPSWIPDWLAGRNKGTGAKMTTTDRKAADADAWAAAQATEKKYGVPAAVTYAQWALESGHGSHMPAGSNNPFGIKASGNQPFVESQTTEVINGQAQRVMARFRKFSSLQEAFEEHAKLLATRPQYKGAMAHKGDAGAFADALTGVYATDPGYGGKLRSIMAAHAGATGGKVANVSTSNTHIEKVEVHTAATDANGIAKDIKPALERQAFASQANFSHN